MILVSHYGKEKNSSTAFGKVSIASLAAAGYAGRVGLQKQAGP